MMEYALSQKDPDLFRLYVYRPLAGSCDQGNRTQQDADLECVTLFNKDAVIVTRSALFGNRYDELGRIECLITL